MAAIPIRKPAANKTRLATNVTNNVMAIFYSDYSYRLRRPISLVVYKKHGFWIHEYAPLGISALGEPSSIPW